ncbi:MAG: peptidoglycan recognition protein family protein [Rhodothermia bacterium]|nr:peptidoglycan recognition protein family protein [Rhodothermia bacterium]
MCTALLLASCAGSTGTQSLFSHSLPENVVRHAVWEVHRPGGVVADGIRKNLAPGDTASLHGLVIQLEKMIAASDTSMADSVRLGLSVNGQSSTEVVAEGAAFNWGPFHIAVLAARTDPGELGAGIAEIEVGRAADLPEEIATAISIDGPRKRLRIPHNIRMITLHHSGSAEPLRPNDNVPEKLRELQLWSEDNRNWWDVPYHFLIGLDGTIYEGRDYRFRGETNTRYDVNGHLLISVLGNYELQEPTPEQVEAIADLMAWGVAEFNVPLDRIYGHSDLAETSCPGQHLRRYLEDGTFRQGIRDRLGPSVTL